MQIVKVIGRALVFIAAVLLGSLLPVSMALAHIEVNPKSAAANSTVDVQFKVPNENTGHAMTKLEVTFSGEQPVASANLPSIRGWSSSVEIGASNSVTNIVWERGQLPPGATETFVATLLIPRTGERILFRTVQTFADGTVTRWVDEPLADGGEPPLPAPVMQITGGAAAVTSTVAPTTTRLALPAAEETEDKPSGIVTPGRILMAMGVGGLFLIFARAKKKNQSTD